MADEKDEFDKIFSEIINSEELKNISDTYSIKDEFSFKDLILIQQSLIDSLANISDIIRSKIEQDDEEIIISKDSEEFKKLSELYKVSEEFNDCISDNFVIFTTDEEEDDEPGSEDY